MIQAARNGGSIAPELLTQLKRLSQSGQVSLYEQCQVSHALWQHDAWQVQCNVASTHDCLVASAD